MMQTMKPPNQFTPTITKITTTNLCKNEIKEDAEIRI